MKPLLPGETIDWTSRGLKKEILEEFGIYSPYTTDGSEDIRRAVVFPSYGVDDGKLRGWKLRDLEGEERTGTKDGNIHVEGELTLFGQQRVPKDADTICIVEGEIDAPSVASVMPSWCVVAIPGSNHTDKVRASLKFIRSFKKIVLCLDNDAAGQRAESEILAMLPSYKTFVVRLGLNDPNEYLQAEQIPALRIMLNGAKCSRSSALTTDDQYSVDDSSEDEEDGFTTGIQPLDLMLGYGLHLTEFLVLGGFTGIGKSHFSAQLAYNLLTLNNIKLMYVATEMSHRQMMRKMSQTHLGRRFHDKNASIPLTAEQKTEAADFIYERVRFNKEPLTNYKTFYDEAVAAILVDGVRVIFVDVLSDFDGFSDWKKAIDIMEMLKKLADGDTRENIPPVAVIAVSHTSGRDEALTIDSLRGGAAIRQKATCVISIDGDREGVSRTIAQLKHSRNFSIGIISPFEVVYDNITTRYEYNGETVYAPDMEGEAVRQHDRTSGASGLPGTDIPSNVVQLHPKTGGEKVPDHLGQPDVSQGEDSTFVASRAQVHTGFPDTGDTNIPGGERVIDNSRPNQATISEEPEPGDEPGSTTTDAVERVGVAEQTRRAEQKLRMAIPITHDRYSKREDASAVVHEEQVPVSPYSSLSSSGKVKRQVTKRNYGA